ncbi:MAG: bifunctional oligoribonuclease/PAP phosphatase NrnA [Caldilinea sp.]
MTYQVPAELINAILKADKILCVSHVNADGDAYGSVLGMTWILRSVGKRVTPAMPDPLDQEFSFLPGADEIILPAAVGADYDLIVCLDMSSQDRMGAIFDAGRHASIPLVVIDHHVTNTNFGLVNWVEAGCAATCQMLVALAQRLQTPIDQPLAECLLTGIVTDTLCFRTSNTTPDVLEAAMLLQRAGADLAQVVQRTLNRLPFSTLHLWSLVLAGAQLRDGVVWVAVSKQQLRATGDEGEDTRLNSVLASVNEAAMSAIFTEKSDDAGGPTVECSFRAKPGYNVGDLAFRLGGGGHAPASGCTLSGALDAVVERVIPMMIEERRRQSRAGEE